MPLTTRYAAAIAVLVAGCGVQPAMAAPDDRLELTVGAGYLAHQYGGDSDSPALVGDIGVSVWLNEHWGLAARYWRTADYELSYGWYRYPYLYHGRGHLDYATLTGRYRLFLDNQVELALGFGALLRAGSSLRLDYRAWHPYGAFYSERSTRQGGESIDESRREPWGRGIAIETLVGRKVSRRVGIRGGLTFVMASGNILIQPVVQAVVSF